MGVRTILVYGSLRKDHYNNAIIKRGRLIGTTKMRGWDMYSFGSFPAIVKGEGEVVVEAWEVPEDEFNAIDNMELGAGYLRGIATVSVEGEELEGFFWYYAHAPNDRKVEGGDWNGKHNE